MKSQEIWYSDSCPQQKIAPLLGLGFWSRSGLFLGLGATRNLRTRKIVPLFRLGFGLGFVLGLRWGGGGGGGGQFSSGVIVLEPGNS